jgi:hypothetical protein
LFTLWVNHDGLMLCLHPGGFRRFGRPRQSSDRWI